MRAGQSEGEERDPFEARTTDGRRMRGVTIGLATLASVATGAGLGWAGYLIADAAGRRGPEVYGLWLFGLLPLAMGAAGSLVVNRVRVRSAEVGLPVGLSSYLVPSVAVLFVGAEGLICLAMALPLYIGLFALGYLVARSALALWQGRGGGGAITASLLPLLALATLVAAREAPRPARRTQTTTIEIDAPPGAIWPLLFRMDAIPPPSSPLFRWGVAHPVAVASSGTRPGDTRQCVLSTGTMPETIEVSEPGRRLRFRVLATPPSMREVNPFGPVDAGHLRGGFTVQAGEFRLVPLPGGRTRLIGTSEYTLAIAPAAYWDLWADPIVDGVHRGVMEEIARRVERAR